MSEPIISNTLPECLRREAGPHDVLIVRGIKDVVQESFRVSQLDAIQRFCEEVARQQLRFMESEVFAAMGQFTPEYAQAAAFQMIRDKITSPPST